MSEQDKECEALHDAMMARFTPDNGPHPDYYKGWVDGLNAALSTPPRFDCKPVMGEDEIEKLVQQLYELALHHWKGSNHTRYGVSPSFISDARDALQAANQSRGNRDGGVLQ